MKSARTGLVLFAAALFVLSAPLVHARSYHNDRHSPAKSACRDVSGGYPEIHSDYAVLMDADTGKVLFARNPYSHREPASLTKMAAAIVLLQNGRLSDTVVAPYAVEGIPPSSLNLSPGEKISLKDLLYAMLLRSANDTPVAGAYYLCGGIAPFVDLMNQKAREIGCDNTHFVTPNGLYAPDHYSCAYDLALIARYATLHLPMFDKIVKTRRYTLHRSIHVDDSLVVNTASTFLKDYPGADGIKTGYISQAGHCFVGSATHNGWRLIAVALDSYRCREDVEAMLSYGFAHYRRVLAMRKSSVIESVPVAGGTAQATVMPSRDLYDVIPKDAPAPAPSICAVQAYPLTPRPAAPIAPGERVGRVTLFVAGKPVDSVGALAVAAVAARPRGHIASGWTRNIGPLGTILLAAGGALLGLTALAFLGLVFYARAITENSRRRRARLAKELRAVD